MERRIAGLNRQMRSTPFVVSAVGDIVLLHPIVAAMRDAASSAAMALLRDADAAIGNCEFTAFAAADAPTAQAESGGLWLHTGSNAIADLAALGFTMVSRANNHACDFGADGMAQTDRLLSDRHIGHAGTGPTLAAARAPAIVPAGPGRLALVSATDTAPRHSVAGMARADVGGRPGVNAIRAGMAKIVDPTTFGVLEMAVQAAAAQGYTLGHLAPDGRTIHGLGAPMRSGDRPSTVITYEARDVDENLAQVRLARQQADVVIFALHTHLAGDADGLPPDAVRCFAHGVVDAGADLFVSHGPHRLRGVEIYNGRPIFYSLGNFIYHVPNLGPQPADLYDLVGLDASETTFDELIAHLSRAGGEIPHMLSDPTQWESIIARVACDGPRWRVELHPVECTPCAASQPGMPRVARPEAARRVLERLERLSVPFGTEIHCTEGIGVIEYAQS